MDNNNQNSNTFYIAIGVIVLGFYFVYRAIFPTDDTKIAIKPHGINKAILNKQTATKNPVANFISKQVNPGIDPKKRDELAAPLANDPITIASNRTLSEFEKMAHLEMPTPRELHFHPVEIGENIAAVTGTNAKLGVKVTIMAKEGNYTPQQVAQFLTDNGSGIPGFNEALADRLKSSPNQGASNSGSGLSEASLWTAEKDGNITTVAFVNRSDGKGAYLTLINGPMIYFDSNEDRFDKIYSQLKALP